MNGWMRKSSLRVESRSFGLAPYPSIADLRSPPRPTLRKSRRMSSGNCNTGVANKPRKCVPGGQSFSTALCGTAAVPLLTVCRMKSTSFHLLAFLLLTGCVLLTQTGCLGLLSNFMHAVGADRIPPEYDGFEKSKVAIVTMTDQSQYSDDVAARLLTRKVSDILSMEVKEMALVHDEAIQQWRDTHGWETIDYLEMGKDIKAEKLLSIEMTDMRLRDGATLYRGRAAIVLTVYDIAAEKVVFRKEIDEFTYPTQAGQYTSETTETKFRKLFLSMLAKKIGRTFHSYDFADTVALDASLASQ
ncbi:hypothetical protein Poly21_24250 [Allorhodopirellula heiligendammensis]|uniref:Uncharacterized protein n=2 Tax=Allorhodopirellula heiligendammensis TaxID=2714739 RepID=A0A5C6BUV5_9BACT|nr:hypothetical protein Poly21_24250 [Allorhodopirellula heiligendammensis]